MIKTDKKPSERREGAKKNAYLFFSAVLFLAVLNSYLREPYTKIANDGSELPNDAKLGNGAKDWACTKDNKTGLIWEIKTDDDSLRDKDWTYTWYEPDPQKNGGHEGYVSNSSSKNCLTHDDNCNTYNFVNNVNRQGLCGAKDWRLPTKNELFQLVVYCPGEDKRITVSRVQKSLDIYMSFCADSYHFPIADPNYFPETRATHEMSWSSSTSDNDRFNAWASHLNYYPDTAADYKHDSHAVQLVRK